MIYDKIIDKTGSTMNCKYVVFNIPYMNFYCGFKGHTFDGAGGKACFASQIATQLKDFATQMSSC